MPENQDSQSTVPHGTTRRRVALATANNLLSMAKLIDGVSRRLVNNLFVSGHVPANEELLKASTELETAIFHALLKYREAIGESEGDPAQLLRVIGDLS